jgi:putative N6-adenine-specific DNA methylase
LFIYQKNHTFFAQCAEGLEEMVAAEFEGLGATDLRPAYRGVAFRAIHGVLYDINYRSRLASRVIAPLAGFVCRSPDELYRRAKALSWKQILGPQHTFAVFANVSNSLIRHSQYAALKLKDAVADYFREECGRRPNVHRIDPDLWLNLHIDADRAVVGLDTSGGSLHRRGYRRARTTAPMQETIAAAVILRSKWDGSQPLYDPMCGSGTLLAEALMHYCRIPAGYLRRRFGFAFLPDFDRQQWKSVKSEADRRIRPLPTGLIAGSDLAEPAVSAARTNLRLLPMGDRVALTCADFRFVPDLGERVIVCNPPYGVRLGETAKLTSLYRELGDFLKQRCKGGSAYVFCGNRALLKHIGLRTAWKMPLKTGGLDGRLVKYELY